MRKHFVKLAEEEIYLRQLNAQEKLLKKWSNDEMGRAIHEINGQNSPVTPQGDDNSSKNEIRKIGTAIIVRQDAIVNSKKIAKGEV